MSLTYMTGLGKKSKAERKKKRQERRKGRKERIAKFALAPARAAFLKAVEKNVMKLADKLARAYKKDNIKLLTMWTSKFKGDPQKLKQAIEKGIRSKLGETGSGAVAPAGIPSPLSAALPIIQVIIGLLKQMGILSSEEEEQDNADINDAKTNIELNPKIDKGNIEMPEGEYVALLTKGEGSRTTDKTEEETIPDENEAKAKLKKYLLIGGGIAAALFVYSMIKRQRPQQ